MDWMQGIRGAIDYMEEHLLDSIHAEDIAKEVGISSFYLQKGFKLMTEYTMAEYIRNRRMYLAGLDVLAGQEKVIDLAYKYGYDTPESFTKAFTRFHGLTPMQLKKSPSSLEIFQPLKVIVTIQGGSNMDYTVEKISGFKLIGFEREFSNEEGYAMIPKYWDEFSEKYMMPLMSGKKAESEIENAICNYCVGEFGVCIDDAKIGKTFRYLIAGRYTEGEVPEGMTVFEFPDMKWAKFKAVGPMPGALQSLNTKLFKEWLPGNQKYEIATGANIEWYSKGDCSSADYESGIWIPVKKK